MTKWTRTVWVIDQYNNEVVERKATDGRKDGKVAVHDGWSDSFTLYNAVSVFSSRIEALENHRKRIANHIERLDSQREKARDRLAEIDAAIAEEEGQNQ